MFEAHLTLKIKVSLLKSSPDIFALAAQSEYSINQIIFTSKVLFAKIAMKQDPLWLYGDS